MLLADKKTINQLGSRMNDAAASKPSDIAMKLMAKMGWKEGQGLGKNADGIAQHIVVKKRDDNVGLGLEDAKVADAVADNWWHDHFSSNLAAFKTGLTGSEKKKDKKSKGDKKDKKKDKRSESANGSGEGFGDAPSFEELFKATGGKRLGMRARMDQKGKFLRTEQLEKATTEVPSSSVAKPAAAAAAAAEETPRSLPKTTQDSDEKSSSKKDSKKSEKKDKKEKKEKKDKKDKKEKKRSSDSRSESADSDDPKSKKRKQ